jgi:hypothetical protein
MFPEPAFKNECSVSHARISCPREMTTDALALPYGNVHDAKKKHSF